MLAEELSHPLPLGRCAPKGLPKRWNKFYAKLGSNEILHDTKVKKCDASITCSCFPFSHPIFPSHFPRLCDMTRAERYLQHSSLHFSTLYLCKSLIADTLCRRSIKTAKRQLEAFAGKLPQHSRCALEYQALMALKSDTPVPYEAADCLA